MADYDVKPHPHGGWQVVRRGRGVRTPTRYATCAAAQAGAWLHAGADGGMLFVHGQPSATVAGGGRPGDRLRSSALALAAAVTILAPARAPRARAAALALGTALVVRPRRTTTRPAA